MDIINTILNKFKDVPDLITRKVTKRFKNIYILYLETVTDGDLVNNYVLRALSTTKFKNLSEIISAPNLKEISLKEVNFYLCNGFAVITDNKTIFAFEARANLSRGIEASNVEPALYGPKDSFLENYQINIGLIKKRIKTHKLKTKEINLGRYSETKTGILYISDIVKKELIIDVLYKLNNIDTDAITSSGELKQFLSDENKNVFPAVELTERPDTVVKALLAGKIAIVVDNSPFIIVLPTVLADHINPTVDKFTNSINTNFLKLIRVLCFIITIITPAIYIAITNYNHESVPTKFLMNIAVQRFGVPFPSLIEALIMLFICELLRESDLRFPNGYGSAISILGALIIGESAVASGLASPIMIIVIALTFLASLIFNEVELSGALRYWRYIFLIFAGFWGLYGFSLALIIFLTNLSAYESFSLTYMFPISPFDPSYLKETLIKSKREKNIYRSKYLSDNVRKQK